jgi:hypothetical protein
MRQDHDKSYSPDMLTAVKTFLLFAIVSQASLMPVPVAFAALQIHNDSYEHLMLMPPATVSSEHQHPGKFNHRESLSSTSSIPSIAQETPQQDRCGLKNGVSGDCDNSCPCTSIMSAPVIQQIIPVLGPTEHAELRLVYPPYSVVIAPLLRPPSA